MRKATLTRTSAGPEGAFGRIVTDSGFICFSAENDRLKIPEGIYRCTWRVSPKFGPCYHLENVPGRTHILIHAANWPYELLGCIAPGVSVGTLAGKRAVISSRQALHALEADLRREPFELTIIDRTGGTREAAA